MNSLNRITNSVQFLDTKFHIIHTYFLTDLHILRSYLRENKIHLCYKDKLINTVEGGDQYSLLQRYKAQKYTVWKKQIS